MDNNIDQVDALMQRADISYEEANAALAAANGDLLEALIKLEQEGKTKRTSASFSTNGNVPIPCDPGTGQDKNNGGYGNMGYDTGRQNYGSYDTGRQNYESYDYKKESSGFGDIMRGIWGGFVNVVRRGNANHFEVYRHGSSVLSIPVTALVLILIFAFWFALPAIVVGLFFGCRYRFRGPDLGRDGVNSAMNSAADVADNIKQSVKDAGQDYKNNK